MPPDLRVDSHGTLALLHPESAGGRAWIDEHFDREREDVMFMGQALVIEHSFVQSVVDGARRDGMEVR